METLVAVVLPGLEVLQKQLVLEENLKSISTAIATVTFCDLLFFCLNFVKQQIRIKGGIPSAPPVVVSSAAAAAPAATASSPTEVWFQKKLFFANSFVKKDSSASASTATAAAAAAAAPVEKKEDSTLVKAKNMFERLKFGTKKKEPDAAPKSDNEK